MSRGLLAKAETAVDASPQRVWQALTDPDEIAQYMFGARVLTDWKVGSPITWKGEWKGKPYEDKGEILRVEPERMLQYTHYSGMSGKSDIPENYHTVTITLSGQARQTIVTLTQDNNPDENAKKHSDDNWAMMLKGMKRIAEQGHIQ
ncbi:MAG: SRPBCC domain-containing protein [Rhodanobacteraceae bacterium]